MRPSFVRITSELTQSAGCVYAFNRRELKFERIMEMVLARLQGISKSKSMLACLPGSSNSLHSLTMREDDRFNALHKGIAEKWVLRDETVKLFGDKRKNLRFVCSFDLDQDILYYSDETCGYGHIQIPLSRFRDSKHGPVQASEFTPFELSSPSPLNLTEFSPPFKEPSTPISDRRLQFASRILSDFAHQWRHVLRSCYVDPTFRRFARAIVSIATYTFQVDEVSISQHISFRSSYVTIVDVPVWEPYEHHILRIGGTTVVLDQDLQSALNIAREDAKVLRGTGSKEPTAAQANTYLLLSVRHMMACHVDSTGNFSYTAPTTLLPPRTPVHHLPLEIQDRILEQVSEGPIEAARLGCLLELGSPFTWMRFRDPPRRGGAVELFISPSHRYENSPVESKICFGDDFSGLSYR